MDNPWREIVAEWKGDTAFLSQNNSGGTVVMGVTDLMIGMSPMELILASLAGCTGSDVVNILKKAQQPLQDLKISVRGKRAQEHPRVYTDILIEFQFLGEGLDPQIIEKAIKLSEEKYCSVSAMLRETAKISFSYQLQE